jgi:hypothetical protein
MQLVGNKYLFTSHGWISCFKEGLGTAPSPSTQTCVTTPSSNHVNASISSVCTQGSEYVLFGQLPQRSADKTQHNTPPLTAGAQFKAMLSINIYPTIFKSLIKYPNKLGSNDAHACRTNVIKLTIVCQRENVQFRCAVQAFPCLPEPWDTDRPGLQNMDITKDCRNTARNHAHG